ncbi:SPOCS domain-containing protein [Halanaerobaculum tunisiense]
MACVLNNSIEIEGICKNFPNNCQGAFTQLKVPEILEIPEQKPDIEQVLQVLVEGKVTNLRIIETPEETSEEGQALTGEKLVIEGKIRQKVVYVADVEDGSQPVHSAEFEIPFSTFIVVPKCYVGTVKPGKEDNINVQVCVEDVFIETIDPRKVIKSVLLYINAIFPPADDEDPSIDEIITSVPNNFTIGDNILIQTTVNDNCSLDRVEIVITDDTGAEVDSLTESVRGETNATVTFLWETEGLTAGDYTASVTVYDCEGNEASDTATIALI